VSIRLSRDEAWAALAGAHTGVLVTLRSDGVPIALPVWFVALDQRIFLATPDHTAKVGRVRRDPRCSFLVESGRRWAELTGVHLTGRASVVTDPAVTERVLLALHAKYDAFRTPRSDMPDATRRHYEASTTVIVIEPDERIITWDNSRSGWPAGRRPARKGSASGPGGR
jgi:PPOX class probable F420-dependent enzyme